MTPTRIRLAAVLLGAGLVCAGGPAAAQGQPATVLVEHVEEVTFAETTPVLARLVATVESEVAARTAGLVDQVAFRVGDRVTEGDLLVRLDSDLIEIRRRTALAALEAARAGVRVAEASALRAQLAFERQSGLQGSAAFSKGQFEDLEQAASEARSEIARAQAQVGQAEAELARADYDMEHAQIHAPLDGVVIERRAQPGSYLSLGQSVARLIDVDALEIEADIPARLVPALSPDLVVSARFDVAGTLDEAAFEATLRSVLPVETVSTRTRVVRFSADLSGLDTMRLASGTSLTLDIPRTPPRPAIMVPKDALVQSGGGWIVFLVEDGTATPREVTLGQPQGARMEVLSGLVPGDAVVVRGNERLRPGQPVTPRAAEPDVEASRLGTDKG